MKIIVFFVVSCISVVATALDYPMTPKRPVIEKLHGTTITDDYRWLEEANNPEVIEWIGRQEKLTYNHLEKNPFVAQLTKRFDELWRYDDESLPSASYIGTRIFYSKKSKNQNHWIRYTKAHKNAKEELVIDPNTWPENETLDFFYPSRDGNLIAFGKAMGGNEAPVMYIMETATKKILPDTFRGWRQRISAWLPDGSGFYYTCYPSKGEVPEGEEHYWNAVYFHKIGTQASDDTKIWWSDDVKERWHWVSFSEDGKYEIFGRGVFYANELYIRPADSTAAPTPIAIGFDGQYSCDVYGEQLFITTNKNAPRYKVYVTTVDKPQREYWQDFLPETTDVLESFSGINGLLYATYTHNAYSSIKIYKPDGTFLRDVTLPGIGSAGVSGWWGKQEVKMYYQSFAFPSTVYTYDPLKDTLTVLKKPRSVYKTKNIISEQVWYTSKDGTKIPMFIIYKKGTKKNGDNPVLLSGYGGFQSSVSPYFSALYYTLIEKGVIVALPCLRGGSEFGDEWHQQGMLDKKQNVFDDFIAAAEWLIAEKYTKPSRLAIQGGSNGGLLMGAVTVQRPDLFGAVLCQVPLLDMLRFHKFGYANIWAKEYGSAEDPVQFEYIRKYSPYHNIRKGIEYPPILFAASANDARTAPLHAMKMAAAMQSVSESDNPILLLVNKDSGHGGGTTLDKRIRQIAIEYAFLLHHIGVSVK